MESQNMLSLLNTREYFENKNEELFAFEKGLNIKLPPIYKLFHQTYSLGESAFRKRKYYLHSSGRKLLISRNNDFIPKPGIMPPMDRIFNLKEIEPGNENYKEYCLKEKQLLPIMFIDNSMIITVGYGSGNQDQIFLLDTDQEEEERFLFLGENVFHYLRGVEVFDDIEEDHFYSKLYCNWKEDFWRVKKDKDKI